MTDRSAVILGLRKVHVVKGCGMQIKSYTLKRKWRMD